MHALVCMCMNTYLILILHCCISFFIYLFTYLWLWLLLLLLLYIITFPSVIFKRDKGTWLILFKCYRCCTVNRKYHAHLTSLTPAINKPVWDVPTMRTLTICNWIFVLPVITTIFRIFDKQLKNIYIYIL